MASLNVPCRAGLAGATGSPASCAPIERGKNSYQAPYSARGPVDPQRVPRRGGDELAHRVVVDELLQVAGPGRGRRGARRPASVSRSAARRGDRARALVLRQRAGQLVEQPRAGLEVVGEVLAALAGLDLDRDGVVPGRERVAPRLDRERRRPGRVGGDRRRASGRCPGAPGSMRTTEAFLAAASRTTTLAPTASWPSRNTVAVIGDRLAHDRPGGELRRDGGADDRADVGESEASYHSAHVTQGPAQLSNRATGRGGRARRPTGGVSPRAPSAERRKPLHGC